ncbi:dimethyl sulfoxide reductase anchor subunit family protein [Phyllobacterium endophyticum]|uniref:DMSO reductase n=1 Tax=Phyllobacterium endophyticum TaxID=1149773 RepID=A0A2P7AU34_9HYPH|nr:DmsC/YnfH family molybdoenzyme membrane anchor subunit [Phyllobacterium endophyticum]MBB3234102.1 DMSO reductase anchor subunit [Phyllobacterium endophyticum]PSH57673.1 DMSO reductase [Phyllobacterium endophyticum]TYR43866.1 DMSO reductase [Phyllobacterium endophyticum]
MHPATSMIVFTTLSGMGFGLAVVLGIGFLDPSLDATTFAYGTSLLLISVGLLASLFHLGNPRRAWRALSQWRSSWLSREGVMAIATFVPLTLSAVLAICMNSHDWIVGSISILGALLTVYCTSMIYASLKAVVSWHTKLTPLCFLLFSLSGGFLLASAFVSENGLAVRLLALLFLLLALTAKMAWRKRAMTVKPISTPESATGLGFIGRVRLFERPHSLDNYLTREMGFRVARKHAAKLWMVALIFGAILPVFALLLALAIGDGLVAHIVLVTGVIAHTMGIFVERWLFFAEAKHAVMNYY